MPDSSLVEFYPSSRPNGRLRVLFVTNMWPDSPTSHYGIFIQSQARSLEVAGLSVDVLAIRGSHSVSAYAIAPWRVFQHTASGRYQLVHIHTGHAAAVAVWATSLPTVVSYVGGDLLGHPRRYGITLKSRVERRVFRWMSNIPTATITKSHEMETVLPARVRMRNTVVPNGVDLAQFTPRPKEEVRTLLGWSQDEKVALFLGNPSDPRKNVALARAAVAVARRREPGLRLHEAFGLDHEEVPLLLWAADCLVFPSRGEGSPNLVKEAMAAALPIVATPVGDVTERLAGIDGTFVVRAEATAMAPAILAAVSHGRAPAAREAIRSLSLEASAQRVIEVYERVLGDGDRARRPSVLAT
jgi:teichuronic acid biosynthesis glycosyltransferase TuaC